MRLLRLQLSAQLTTNPESFIHSYSIAYYRAFYRVRVVSGRTLLDLSGQPGFAILQDTVHLVPHWG